MGLRHEPFSAEVQFQGSSQPGHIRQLVKVQRTDGSRVTLVGLARMAGTMCFA